MPNHTLDSLKKENLSLNQESISIGITTFRNRFSHYFIPLLSKIKDLMQETEIIIAKKVNICRYLVKIIGI